MFKVFVLDDQVVKVCAPEFVETEAIEGAVVYDVDCKSSDIVTFENGKIVVRSESEFESFVK